MDLDFEKSLTYIAKDPQWGNKLLAGSGLIMAMVVVFLFPLFVVFLGSVTAVLVSLAIAMIASFLIWFLISGYVCKAAHMRITEPENETMPDWKDFPELLRTGLKYFFGYFLFVMPVSIVFMAFCGLFLTGIITVGSQPHFPSGWMMFFAVLLGAVALFLYVLTIFLLPLMMSNFFKNQKILSFVNFPEAFSMLKNNIGNYFILILLFVAVSMLVQIVASFLAATVIGLILLPILYFYTYMVIVELVAQFVNATRKEAE